MGKHVFMYIKSLDSMPRVKSNGTRQCYVVEFMTGAGFMTGHTQRDGMYLKSSKNTCQMMSHLSYITWEQCS